MLIHNRVNQDTLLPLSVQILLPSGEAYNLEDSNISLQFKLYSFSGEEVTTSGVVNILDSRKGIVEYRWNINDYNHFNTLISISPGITNYQYKAWFIVNKSGDKYYYPQNNEGILVNVINPSGISEYESRNIEDLLFSPSKIKNLEGQIEERSVSELIEAEMWKESKKTDKVPWGIRIARTRPSSTLS